MNRYKKQLYPPQNSSEVWKLKNNINKDVLLPSVMDVKKIYALIYDLIEEKQGQVSATKEDFSDNNEDRYNIKKYLWSIFSKEDVDFDYKNLDVDLVKGSIYKIKQYFMEANNIRDIRGGSMMIDYLNIDFVKEKIKDFSLSENNVIYCGGGNILLIVPAGKGKDICAYFEREYREMALTIRSAFCYKRVKLNDLLFKYSSAKDDYSSVKDELDEEVRERSKVKTYDMNYDNKLPELNIGEICNINLKKYLMKGNEEKICTSCDIRDAKYYIFDEASKPYLCPSCVRKHILGNCEDELIREFKKYIGEENSKYLKNKEKFNKGSLDNIFDKRDIAVIYGDGNNMGNVVNQIENVFEMMYFSRRTDEVTKGAVYEALYKTMKNESIFEILALGGDDIFIIVPAEYAFEIASNIIKKFDKEFEYAITMSVGIAISKCNTPITTTFNIAHNRLEKAKNYVKQYNLQEGTIDVAELTGEFHDVQSMKISEFPMACSNLDIFIEEIKKAKVKNSRINSQLSKFNYAYHTMEEEEFDLFYLYQKSKDKEYSMDEFIRNTYKTIYEKNHIEKDKEKIFYPHKINWDDISLMWKRI